MVITIKESIQLYFMIKNVIVDGNSLPSFGNMFTTSLLFLIGISLLMMKVEGNSNIEIRE